MRRRTREHSRLIQAHACLPAARFTRVKQLGRSLVGNSGRAKAE
jgi:hypothetical protein